MNIFISYRRIDTESIAGRIYDRAALHFGTSSIFLDVDTIALGVDFRQVLAEAVGRCDVLLALVGDKWLNVTDEAGRRRLDSEDDYLRFEIEVALRREIPVIPVLVGGVNMPSAAQLPSSVREFAFKNGMPISDGPDFERDLARLFLSLESQRPVAWVECVNCCETVIPKADGTCPACRRHALESPDPAGMAQGRGEQVMMRIPEGARLPQICCTCANPTERLVKIYRTQRVGGESTFVRVILALAGSFLAMSKDLWPTVRDVVLHMPHCKVCSSKQRLSPVYIDFERRAMKFMVHREFRHKCKELS
jgi:hypothetical protein